MKVRDSTDLHFSYWHSPKEYPTDSNVLHAWKTISPGYKTLTLEGDAFRKKIDDTLFYQLNVHSKLKRDSTLTVSGMVFYSLTNESKSISLDFDNKHKSLDSLGVDSVKKSWKLNY